MDFIVDENYLVSHTLASAEHGRFSSEESKQDIAAFQRDAWQESKDCYQLLVGKSTPEVLTKSNLPGLSKSLSRFLESVKQGPSLANIYSQTIRYRNKCKKQWDRNYTRSNRIVHKVTGLNLNKSIIVYVTHPSLKNGQYMGGNRIGWGHNEDWKNYTTIYLWHEILHSYFDMKELDHALISLAIDEELRIRLNGGKYPPFQAHQRLQPLMKRILPYWKKYLVRDEHDILKFKREIMSIF